MTHKHDADLVQRVAKAMAYSIRQPNDVSNDAEEYWHHTASLAQFTWMQAARAAIAAMPERHAQRWQPIETAPRDGTPFQSWLTDGRAGRSVLQQWEPLCRYNEHGAFEIWGRVDYDIDGWNSNWNAEWHPTHWMPLPTPPEGKP